MSAAHGRCDTGWGSFEVGLVDCNGTCGPEPRVGMAVHMSAEGHQICQAYALLSPPKQSRGVISAVSGHGSVNVEWESGGSGVYLVGKYGKYMLTHAGLDGHASFATQGCRGRNVEEAGRAEVDHEVPRQATTIGVRVHDSTLGSTPMQGVLGRVFVLADGCPNELTVPLRCVIPQCQLFRIEAEGRVRLQPWWSVDPPTVTITDCDLQVDGRLALITGLEIQLSMEDGLGPPQRISAELVSLDCYVLGVRLKEEGDAASSERLMLAALTEESEDSEAGVARKVGVLIHLASAVAVSHRFGEALAHLQHALVLLQQQRRKPGSGGHDSRQDGTSAELEKLEMMVVGDIGEVYRQTGDIHKAKMYLYQALAHAERLCASASVGECLGYLPHACAHHAAPHESIHHTRLR
jgi:hypothetical protein